MNALITGYSSGIGKAIVETLELNNINVLTLSSRLENVKKLTNEIQTILLSHDIHILIHCAGIGYFEPHEELSINKIEKLIDINLKAPIIITRLLLKNIKKNKGHILFITSIEATRHSKFSATYTATKSGLRNFSLSLFEEIRKDGVKVTSVNPDITDTSFFKNLRFGPLRKKDYYIIASDLAQQIYEIITAKNVITDITIRPQYFGIEKKPS